MTDEKNTRHRFNDDLMARLIRAGAAETPSKRSLQRTLSALGVGGAMLGTSAATASTMTTAGSLSLLGIAKFVALGALGGGVVLSAAYGVGTLGDEAVPARASAPVRAPAVTATATSASAGDFPAVEASAVSSPPPLRPAGARPQTAESKAALAVEIAFVDRCREAFQQGRLHDALVLSEEYERAFERPRLLPEVLYLRLQAYERTGDERRASALAIRLIREYPNNPHSASARSWGYGAATGEPRPR
ncbi:MAG TPA: hypothetical protein VIM73_19235 [Polyangiaceae bacterium]